MNKLLQLASILPLTSIPYGQNYGMKSYEPFQISDETNGKILSRAEEKRKRKAEKLLLRSKI